MKWFRFYTEALHDPKVQRLSPVLFKAWVNLLCLASQEENDGLLPSVEDIAFTLRIKPSEAESILTQLARAGLIDRADEASPVRDGAATGPLAGRYRPHNWTERQRKSDDVAARVKAYRERQAAKQPEFRPEDSAAHHNIVTLHETLQKRERNALDTDTEEIREDTHIPSFAADAPLPVAASAAPARVKRATPKQENREPQTPRQRDPIWDAIVAEFMEPKTSGEKSRYGKAVHDLKKIDATPEQIAERCKWQRQLYEDGVLSWRLTLMALVNNWTEIERQWLQRGSAKTRSNGYARATGTDGNTYSKITRLE